MPVALKGKFFLKTMSKIAYPVLLKNYNSKTRFINWLLLNLKQARGWTWTDLALSFGYDYTEEHLQNHFKFDSSNSFTIARLCEVFNLPLYYKADDFLNGEVNKKIKREIHVRGWSIKDFARKLWGNMKASEFHLYLHRVYKFFDNGSTDFWVIARSCQIFNQPTIPPDWVLNESDRDELEQKTQLEFTLCNQ